MISSIYFPAKLFAFNPDVLLNLAMTESRFFHIVVTDYFLTDWLDEDNSIIAQMDEVLLDTLDMGTYLVEKSRPGWCVDFEDMYLTIRWTIHKYFKPFFKGHNQEIVPIIKEVGECKHQPRGFMVTLGRV